jgi:hypothetical protein
LEIEVTPYVSMVSAALSTAGRSVVVHDGVTPTDLLQKLSVERRGMKKDPLTGLQGKVEQN